MNIGLLGFGVVGGGVLELAQGRKDIAVSRVLLRSSKAGLPESLVTYDFNDILLDDAIDTVVEVMGGLHPAYEYVTAAAKIDHHQMAQYAQCVWRNDAPPEQVLVLHTLVVDPAVKGKGYGTAFVRFYEDMGRETGRSCLRIDTNARNTTARALYARLGYTEAGIVAGTFNGIPGVELVCLEKTV